MFELGRELKAMDQQYKKLNSELSSSKQNDDVDLIGLILDLSKKWKLIFIVIMVGTCIGVLLALKMPRIYQPSAIITLPDRSMVELVNESGLINYGQKTLFKQFYDAVRSESQLSQFIEEKNYIAQLEEKADKQNFDRLLVELLTTFETKILEPDPEKPRSDFVEFPTHVKISLKHANEQVLVDLLHNYLNYVNDEQLKLLVSQSENIKASSLNSLKTTIELLREKALFDRQMQIQRIEEQNELQIEKLENEKKLLIELLTKNRQSQLAQIKEAMSIAEKLDIKNPTPIDEFSANNSEAATNIKLNSQQELPLYLMGTRYLTALTETLKSRNDEQLSTKINELEKQITQLMLDPKLTALKNRKSDDPYIEGLTELVNKQKELQKKSLSFNRVKMFSIQKQPFITNKNVGPKKLLIVVSALLMSGFIGIIIALMRVATERRKARSSSALNKL